MDNRKIVFKIIDLIVFAAAASVVSGVFYEGITLKWYGIVVILIRCMDLSFLTATVVHLITDRKEKRVFIHIFSMMIIIAAIIVTAAGVEYPEICFLLWCFYILFVYGTIAVKILFLNNGNIKTDQKKTNKITEKN